MPSPVDSSSSDSRSRQTALAEGACSVEALSGALAKREGLLISDTAHYLGGR